MPENIDNNYINAKIHRGFYYNKSYGFPSIIQEYSKIEKVFIKTEYIACISINIDQLEKIEYKYGSTTHNQLIHEIMEMINVLKNDEFRKDDIFVIDIFNINTFLIFLSAPRKSATQLLDHLESITIRVSISIKNNLFKLFYPFLKENIQPAIGYALVIKNPMINNLNQISRLINDSIKIGEFMT